MTPLYKLTLDLCHDVFGPKWPLMPAHEQCRWLGNYRAVVEAQMRAEENRP